MSIQATAVAGKHTLSQPHGSKTDLGGCLASMLEQLPDRRRQLMKILLHAVRIH